MGNLNIFDENVVRACAGAFVGTTVGAMAVSFNAAAVGGIEVGAGVGTDVGTFGGADAAWQAASPTSNTTNKSVINRNCFILILS